MKILISSSTFKPKVGGIEVISENMARILAEMGNEVTVITPIAKIKPDDDDYRIVRQASLIQKFKCVRDADIVYSNGASLYVAFWAMFLGKKFVWTHVGYQVSCIDGLAWHNGEAAPFKLWPSFKYHLRKSSVFSAFRGLIKVSLLQFIAKYYASANVAISDWMMNRQPLPNQIRIYNPFPISSFKKIRSYQKTPIYEFVFLGRLVSEKGVNTLIEALSLLVTDRKQNVQLSIIGDGPERQPLEDLSKELGVNKSVHFQGKLTGEDLYKAVGLGKIAVVPSAWEEPFGGVATELMAAGKNIIVSRNGALAELIPDKKMTFENGNADQLATKMLELLSDEDLQAEQLVEIDKKLEIFNENKLLEEYLTLFSKVLGKTPELVFKKIGSPNKA